MKKTFAFILGAALVLAPAVALAQNFTYVNNWVNQLLYWLRLAITVVMIAMTLYFLVNVFKFVQNKEGSKAEDLRKGVINGLIGLFIAVAVWGIIRIAGNVLGVNVDTSNQLTPGVTCPPGLMYNPTTRTCV